MAAAAVAGGLDDIRSAEDEEANLERSADAARRRLFLKAKQKTMGWNEPPSRASLATPPEPSASYSRPTSVSPRARRALGYAGLPKQLTVAAPSTAANERLTVNAEKTTAGGKPRVMGGSEANLAPPKAVMEEPRSRSKPDVSNNKSPVGVSSSGLKMRRQYSNLFPCPLVKTLDLDSPPEGSLSSLGLVHSLHGGPFASSGQYYYVRPRSRAARRPGKLSSRARSVQSPTSAGPLAPLAPPAASGSGMYLSVAQPRLSVSGPPSRHRSREEEEYEYVVASAEPAPVGSWPQRQSSLPSYAHHRVNNTSPAPPANAVNSRGASPGKGPSPVRSPRLKAAKSLHAQTHKLRRQVTICEDSLCGSAAVSRQASVIDSPLPHPVSPVFEAGPAATSPQPSPAAPHLPPPSAVPARLVALPRQESSFTYEEINR